MESLSSALKSEIDTWVSRLRQSELVRLAEQGRVSRHALAYYLASLRYIFGESQQNLALAARRCAAEGEVELARYFGEKANEEVGHDRWADEDLGKLPADVTEGVRVSDAVVALATLQRALLDRHPICFAAYSQWAEYFTVLMGDEWLSGLAQSGFAAQDVTAISKHVEADRSHAAAGFVEIDLLYRGDPPASEIVDGVRAAERLFEQFSLEVAAVARESEVSFLPSGPDRRGH